VEDDGGDNDNNDDEDNVNIDVVEDNDDDGKTTMRWRRGRMDDNGLVLILAGALFYGTVSFQKKLVSKYTVP
jgi:hypothetical protein